jgi:DNA polymerase-3 subunit alpha
MDYSQRLEDELETIRFTGFDRYFLIVSEYCDWARKENIRVGAGRGSGCGSLVLYCLGVTGLDPIKYKLGMDRFLYCEAEYRAGIGDFYSNQENPKWESQNRGCRTREKSEKEKDLEKRLINTCKKKISSIQVSDIEKKRIKDELLLFIKNPTLIDDLMDVMKYKQESKLNGDINRCNSYLFSFLGVTDSVADLSKDFNFVFIIDKKQSRISPPDIDIDFEQRDAILQHLCKIYGPDKVALIGTANTYRPKASVQFAAKAADVTRTNNPDEKRFSSLNDQEGKRLSKMMINIPNVTLSQWLGEDPNFKPPNKKVQEGIDELKKEKEKNPHIFELAKKLEGKIKAYGTHAAGVVISSGSIIDSVPLHVAKVQRESLLDAGMGWDDDVSIKDLFTTQFDMDEVESLGLLKFDFLQLNNLRQISLTLDLIKKRQGSLDFDIDELDTNDKNVFKIINDMKLEGLFQISGDVFVGKDWQRNDKVTGEKLYKTDDDGKEMLDEKGKKIPLVWHNKGVMEIIGCSSFDDIVVSNALGRPGPLACNMPKLYAEGKANMDGIRYPHEKLVEILEPTYGQLCFQEQLIKMAQVLAGFTFAEADGLRKACAKKKAEMLNDIEPKFREGCKKNNIPGDVVDAMWTISVEFGAYAFNFAHSVAYGFITYQTAYLKTYYTAEFISSLLTSAAMQNDEKLDTVTENLKKEYHGLTILPPDVNMSEKTYIPSKNSGKRKIELIAPFLSIKGVGNKVSDAIVDVRNSGLGTFASVDHFFRAVNSSGKTTISNTIAEILVKIGSFKSFGSEDQVNQEIMMYQSLKKRVSKTKKRYADPILAADPLF